MKWLKENWFKIGLLLLIQIFVGGYLFLNFRQNFTVSNNSTNSEEVASKVDISKIPKSETLEMDKEDAGQTPFVVPEKQEVPKPTPKPQVKAPISQTLNQSQFEKDNSTLHSAYLIVSRLYFLDPGPRAYCEILYNSKTTKNNIYWTYIKDYNNYINNYSKYESVSATVIQSTKEYNGIIGMIQGDCPKTGYSF